MSGIPIRNRATRDLGASKATQDISMIATPAGAIVTGEIRKYETYQEMVSDAQPMRLASVRNASMDENYPVPEAHRGGILFQRDFVNQTWLVLYTTVDMMTNLYIDWSHVLNIPAWVGGVSNNRVRLTSNRYAETRTTYYSYGSFILILPDPSTVGLGDQIILEQYNGQGTVCVPVVGQNGQGVTLNQVDPSLGSTSLYTVQKSGTVSGNVPILDEYNTILSYVCSEDLSGNRMWARISHDTLLAAIDSIRNDFDAHLTADDPHPQYLKKLDLQQAVGELTPITYTLPEATTERLGGSYLATVRNVTNNDGGCLTVTASVLHDVLTGYATAVHNHRVEQLENVAETPSANNQALLWSANSQQWYPTTLSATNVQYDNATHRNRGLCVLASVTDFDNENDNHYVFNGKILHDILDRYRQKTDPIHIVDLADVSIDTLSNGKLLGVGGGSVIQITPPDATKLQKGYIQIASDADIFEGTTIDTKSVTPKQLYLAISGILDDIQRMLDNQSYTLPHATVPTLGGVKLITDENLDALILNYGTSTQIVTEAWTIVNPMQLAKYIKQLQTDLAGLRSDVTDDMNQMSNTITELNNDYVKFRKYMIGDSLDYISANTDSPTYISVIATINANHANLSNRVDGIASDLEDNWTDQNSLRQDVQAVQQDVSNNWSDHEAIRREFAAADTALSDLVGTFDNRIRETSERIDRLLPIRTVILWYGDAAECSENGSMPDWRICDGNVYELINDNQETIKVITPNMFGRYPVGTITSPGEYIRDGLPNLKGEAGGIRGFITNSENGYWGGAEGVFSKGRSTQGVGSDADHSRSNWTVLFNAANGSVDENGNTMSSDDSPFGKSHYVTPRSVSFIYIMKIQDTTWRYSRSVSGINIVSPVTIRRRRDQNVDVQLQATTTDGTTPVTFESAIIGPTQSYYGLNMSSTGQITGQVNNYLPAPTSLEVLCKTPDLPNGLPLIVIMDLIDRIYTTSSTFISGTSIIKLTGTKDQNYGTTLTFYTKHQNPNMTLDSISGLPDGLDAPLVSTYNDNWRSWYGVTVGFQGKFKTRGRFPIQMTFSGDRCQSQTYEAEFQIGPHFVDFGNNNPDNNTIEVQIEQGVSKTISLGLVATNRSTVTYKNLANAPLGVTLDQDGNLYIPGSVPEGTYQASFKVKTSSISEVTGNLIINVYNPIYIDFSMYDGSRQIYFEVPVGETTTIQLELTCTNNEPVTYEVGNGVDLEAYGVSFTNTGRITVLSTAEASTPDIPFTAKAGSVTAEGIVHLNIAIPES